MWKLSTNSPLIFYVPGNKNNGAVCNEAVSLMDIHATLLEMTGLDFSKGLDCISLVPQLNNPLTGRTFPAVITHEEGNNSILWKKYNYIHYKDGSKEFYNHANDNVEFNNVANQKKSKRIIRKLQPYIPVVKAPQANGQKKTMGTNE